MLVLLMKLFHLFHLVELSPWPIFCGIGGLNLVLSLVYWFKFSNFLFFLSSLFVMVVLMLTWFRDIGRESIFQGKHSLVVERGFQLGMLLFIFSEVMFFFSFFWTFFHGSMSPSMEIGVIWPPLNMEGISPFEIPLLNTLILLSSGVSVTWAHYYLFLNKNLLFLMVVTIMLGLYFTFLQYFEYNEALFSFSDSIFGSVFFMATGFHGMHVLIGSIMLIYSTNRLINFHFSLLYPIGLEVSIWYWHFVDVVWLFLFSFIYWWGF